jgi:hypothetical protein
MTVKEKFYFNDYESDAILNAVDIVTTKSIVECTPDDEHYYYYISTDEVNQENGYYEIEDAINYCLNDKEIEDVKVYLLNNY